MTTTDGNGMTKKEFYEKFTLPQIHPRHKTMAGYMWGTHVVDDVWTWIEQYGEACREEGRREAKQDAINDPCVLEVWAEELEPTE